MKHSKYPQTNQFEVWRRLAGLDEKFRIRNNDELADALTVRLEAVKSPSTEWLPEILSLFLHLSSDPANETRIESLDELDRGLAPPAPTWKEIFEEDPLDNSDGIWDTPNYGGTSSNESEISTPRAIPAKLQSRKRHAKEDDHAIVDAALDYEGVESSFLQDLADAQFWRRLPESDRRIVISEIQMIREALFMMRGLPSSIFQQNQSKCFEPKSLYTLPNVSFEAFADSLSSFARIGNQLLIVRKAIKTKSLQPFVQSFQSSLGSELKAVENVLSDIEASIISPHSHKSISVIQILEKVQLVARSLSTMCPVASLVSTTNQEPFAVLEALYDLILRMQSIDDSESYYLAVKLFIDSLSTYLKPISSWMESGILGIDGDTFFVAKVGQEVPLSELWAKQYELVHFEDGTLQAPRFLHIAAKKIFNTGKSIIMLRQLGRNLDEPTKSSDVTFSSLLRNSLTTQPLCPFEEVFAAILDTWIADHYRSYSSILHTALETSCGLWTSIDAIEHIYFYRNSHVASQFASAIFARIDARKGRVWHDRFILTDVLRDTFALIPSVDAQRLAIAIVPPTRQSNSQGSRSVKDLAKMSVIYTLPWSVSNIIKPISFSVFQSISTLLLQISRSEHLLQHVYRAFSASKVRVSRETPMETISLSLQHQFRWFLDTVFEHLTGTVLLQASISMHQKMKAAGDVNQMIEVHESFVRHIGRECFVNADRADVRKAIVSILDLVVLFESIGTVNPAAQKQLPPRTRDSVKGLSESEESDSGEDACAPNMHQRRDAAADICRLTKISDTFDRLLQFIIATLAQTQHESTEDGQRSQALLDNLTLGAKRL